MNQYESVFIMHPVLSEDQVKETVEKFKGLIEAKKGKVLEQEYWGLKKLAYSIQHKRSGFYQLIEFQLSGEDLGGIELEMKRDERVIRFLTVKMDKHHVEFAQNRRKKLKNA